MRTPRSAAPVLPRGAGRTKNEKGGLALPAGHRRALATWRLGKADGPVVAGGDVEESALVRVEERVQKAERLAYAEARPRGTPGTRLEGLGYRVGVEVSGFGFRV
jgi:hypothetical protein